jgi:predicted RNA-binding Zn ribbon-like protein
MNDRAPDALETIRLFVNSLDVESGDDALADPAGLRAWLEDHGLGPVDGASAADVRDAVLLREAFRSLLLENNGGRVRGEAVAVLDRAAARGRLALRFDPSEARLEAGATGVAGALGRLIAIAAAAMANGSWSRLKACRADDCHWAFYDRARNRSRHWCSMAVCGNRTKARSYRRRHTA